MKPLFFAMLMALGGCAGAGRHTVAAAGPVNRVALDSVEVTGVRGGQLSAAREWSRDQAQGPVAPDDTSALRSSFVRHFAASGAADPDAARHLRVRLTLQDTGYYEGLAAETTDLTLTADVFNADGAHVRTITLREPASAPLQRSSSRRGRLDQAIARLTQRLATEL
jgi:hypothetical protein